MHLNIDLTNFHKISAEKQRAVINAGFLCFGQNGYRKTSIQDIADAAGISKASLFQYFGSKKDMYLFFYDFAGKEISSRISAGTDDYFECAERYVRSLADTGKDFPNLFDFLILQSQRRDFSEVEELLDVADGVCQYNADTLYAHVDWSRFRAGFDKETVQNLFNWIASGCIAQLSAEVPREKIYEELLRYLGLFKAVMYKPEEPGGVK